MIYIRNKRIVTPSKNNWNNWNWNANKLNKLKTKAL